MVTNKASSSLPFVRLHQCQSLDFCALENHVVLTVMIQNITIRNTDKFSQLVPVSCSFCISVKKGKPLTFSKEFFRMYTDFFALAFPIVPIAIFTYETGWRRELTYVILFIFVQWILRIWKRKIQQPTLILIYISIITVPVCTLIRKLKNATVRLSPLMSFTGSLSVTSS